jgi:thiamine-phosphate pyrophosphorylase
MTGMSGWISAMNEKQNVEDRCRLVLIVPSIENAAAMLATALEGGDVASILLPRLDMAEAVYAAHVEALTPIGQSCGAAVIVEEDSQAMGRAGADGLFVAGGIDALKDAIARFSPKRIVGFGGVKTRHSAMEAAECRPDFLFFGKPDGDIRPEAHSKNLKLGEWAGEVMQTSVIVMGGSSVESVIDVAQTGVEFVALSLAVFGGPDAPQDAVREANDLLDRHAPRFEDEDG